MNVSAPYSSFCFCPSQPGTSSLRYLYSSFHISFRSLTKYHWVRKHSQASYTKDNHHHFLPSHLLHSSPWYIKLFAVSPFRCDRRDPISIPALSPVPSQCLAHAKGSINTCWTSRYFNNDKYDIASTCWPASARWYDSQEQGIYLFFHLFFPPKFLCTPCVLVCYNKIPWTRWLKQQNFNFSSSRSTSCRAWFLVRALSDLHVAAFSCILTWSFLCVHVWQRSLSPTVSVTLMRTPIPVDQGSAHMTSFMTSPLITFLKALAPNAVTRKVRASTHDFFEGHNSAHS